jgi:urease accessory protein
MHVAAQQPPLRVLRAFTNPESGALVHLHNVSGGILGGDQLSLRVRAEAGSRVQLTTTSATRVYRCKADGIESVQRSEIEVGPHALLEILPDPLIPFAGAHYRQEMVLKLGEAARLFWWEVLTPGREARGEVFAYKLVYLATSITAAGMPVAWERMAFEPGPDRSAQDAVFGPYRYLSTCYLCSVGASRQTLNGWEGQLTALAAQFSTPGDSLWGVSTLAAHGLIIRGLSRSGRDIATQLFAFWRLSRALLGEPTPTLPRKLY